MTALVLPTISDRGAKREKLLADFAQGILQLSKDIGFRMSSRGWGYQLEGFGLINKSQLNAVESLINECRKNGLVPVDFTMDEEGRTFSGVELPDTGTSIKQFISRYLMSALSCEYYYTPDWWEDETYYIQMLVEKIDLKTLFEPICQKYHIPIATTKGWSSILQRAEYGKRFQEADDDGKKCVLLYCGDHDPDGILISDTIRSNLFELVDSVWDDGSVGYNPTDLIIDRFGLNYDFIIDNNLTWIDNLISGSGSDLSVPRFDKKTGKTKPVKPYILEYIGKYGKRKCEANALVVRKDQAHTLCRNAIEKYLGNDARVRFERVRTKVNTDFCNTRKSMVVDGVSLDTMISNVLAGEQR